MALTQIASLMLVFLAVAGVVFALLRLLIPTDVKSRLERVVLEKNHDTLDETTQWEEAVNKISSPFVSLSLPSEGWENSALRTRFMHAGYRKQTIPYFYFGGKTFLALLLPGIFFFFGIFVQLELSGNGYLLSFLSLAALGYYIPNFILSHIIEVRQRDLFENFPDAIDLMTICIEAGLGLDAAMKKVGEEMYIKCVPLAEELYLVNLEMRAGRSREHALRNLGLRTGVEEIEGFVSTLIQADRFGTSIGTSLRVHSDMLRTKRRLRAEEAAAKIALKLLFPLIFFIFPAFMVVIMGPGAISIIRVLLPTMAGN